MHDVRDGALSAAALGQAQRAIVPAYFSIDTRSDPLKSTDWNRIKEAGPAVQIVIADARFETAVDPEQTDARNQFLANSSSPANQLVVGYVNTEFGTDQSALAHVDAWHLRYSYSDSRDIFR